MTKVCLLVLSCRLQGGLSETQAQCLLHAVTVPAGPVTCVVGGQAPWGLGGGLQKRARLWRRESTGPLVDILFAWRSQQGRVEAGRRKGVVWWQGPRGQALVLRWGAGRSWAGSAVGCRWVFLTQSHVSAGGEVRGAGPT